MQHWVGRHSCWLNKTYLKHLPTKQPLLTDCHKLHALLVRLIHSLLLCTALLREARNDTITSSKLDTTALAIIQCKTSPITIKGTQDSCPQKLKDMGRNASSVEDMFSTVLTFLVTSVNVSKLTPNLLVGTMPFGPSLPILLEVSWITHSSLDVLN